MPWPQWSMETGVWLVAMISPQMGQPEAARFSMQRWLLRSVRGMQIPHVRQWKASLRSPMRHRPHSSQWYGAARNQGNEHGR